MQPKKIYDVAGIGIGPFNLGFAALSACIPSLDCIFFDRQKSFEWHPGMMLDFASLQVPFFADLVTTADPCNRFSFLSYLKQENRLFQFAILEENYISRKEYNLYCQWVASQLSCLRFSSEVVNIDYDEGDKLYRVQVAGRQKLQTYYSRKLLLGTGTVPSLPGFIKQAASPFCIHSSSWLFHKKSILEKDSITIVGSGQSAAEIFYDLLQNRKQNQQVQWFTKAGRFYPMDISKLSFEMTSPDYIDYFFNLEPLQKSNSLKQQDALYKGINQELIAAIYKLLYQELLSGDRPPVTIATLYELTGITAREDGFELSFLHSETQKRQVIKTGALIAATGYKQQIPACIDGIRDRINLQASGLYDVRRNYSVDIDENSIYVQNGELHTHGFSAPDLGMGGYRNACIINSILGYEHFKTEKRIAFQHFGMPV